MPSNDLAAAVERLRRIEAGENPNAVYSSWGLAIRTDQRTVANAYLAREAEDAKNKRYKSVAELVAAQAGEEMASALAAEQLRRAHQYDAWTDPTPLTLDVLRRVDVLGEPHWEGESIVVWFADADVYVEWKKLWEPPKCIVDHRTQVRTLGQLRRILSVIQETTPGGGDAAK